MKDGLKICNPAEENVENRIKTVLHVDKSIDISDKAQLLAYIHFIHENEIISLCAAQFPEDTKQKDILCTLKTGSSMMTVY